MRVLHLITEEPSATIQAIIREQERVHQVQVIRLDLEGVDYDQVIQAIEQCDRVMAW